MIILEDILSQEVVQRLGWTLLHFVWQAAVVASLLAILLRVLRKSTPSLRYTLACLALALIVLLPVITLQLVPVSAPHSAAHIEPAPAPAVLSIEEMPPAETTIVEEPVQLESVAPISADSWKQRTIETLEPALPYIVSGWLLGVFGLSIWHLGGWAQLQRLRRRMVKQVNDTLGSKLKVLAERLRVKQTVQLMESALVQIPTVVGWLRPVILLPASALTGLSAEQLEAILAHELAHIRRYDYLVNILQTIVEILGFYHPAVWWISHKIRAERENCCDDLAVSISGDRVCYARALTSMEEIRAGRGQLAVAASGGNLFRRICRLLGKDSGDKTGFSWIPAATAILLIIALVIPTTLAFTTKSDSQQPDSKIDVHVENDRSGESQQEKEPSVDDIPTVLPTIAKSPTPSAEDKAHVQIDCLIVEVSLDSKMDRETTIMAENLLGNKISLRDTKVGVLLRKAAEATAPVENETANDKRVTQKKFETLVDMMISKGYMKILMNPTIEVINGKTARISSSQHVPLQVITKTIPGAAGLTTIVSTETEYIDVVDSIEITPHVFADGYIGLLVEAAISSISIPKGIEQIRIVTTREISTRVRTSPGESLIIGGLKETGKSSETDRNVKGPKEKSKEVLFIILTPTIITPSTDSQEKTDVRIESKEAMVHRVYDISGLVETDADADDLIRRITETIEPDGWYGLSETGEGTIIAYPLRQPKKFAVMQTYEIHQQIEHFLDDMRSSRDELPEPNLPLAPEVPLITNTFIDSDLVTVLQDIASMAGIPIIPDETVVGLVTAKLQNVPLETALDIVLGGTPYVVKKTPYYYLVASAVELVEIEKRVESAKKLSNLGTALRNYADDYEDRFPDSMQKLQGYPYLNEEEFEWALANVKYLAKGKMLADPPDVILAYDKKILTEGMGTNILRNDTYVGFVPLAKLKELLEVEKRFKSAKKLFRLGTALRTYANDYEDRFPDSMQKLQGYPYLNEEEFEWALANVKYLAKGKMLTDPPDVILAYDKKILTEGMGTNILRNDTYVGFVKFEELKKLGISATEILIVTKFLSVSEDFLKDVGLDANSISTSYAWSEHLVADSAAEPNSETYSLILDDLHIRFLLKAVQAHQGSKILAAPQVLTLEGMTASMAIMTEELPVLDYNEPNDASDEPQPKIDYVEIGTRIWLKPELTPDNENIELDFKLEIRQLLGFEERKYKGKYPYKIPKVDVVSIKMRPLIPDGKTLLIGGLKIIEKVESRSSAPLLSKLPVVGGLFKRSTITDIKDHKMLLILVKPIINPQQKASKILRGQEDSEEHIKSLARQLEKKLKRHDKPK
ncbi:MAG: M48 family metalloprotease [Planctomycetes bacterium]|nr:M48 family metalloprotease [Planctomycetota bacterium]